MNETAMTVRRVTTKHNFLYLNYNPLFKGKFGVRLW